MRTLRVLIASPQSLERPAPWALFDASGRTIDRGVARAAAWPPAERVEAVLAASLVRIASIALPPLAPSQVGAAARFALEDQLAGPAEAHHVAASVQSADGRVRVVVASQRDVAALASAREPPFARVIAESDLALPLPAWRWCVDADGGGFVRLPDGGAFPAGAPSRDTLPAELALALARAQRDNAAPSEVVADRDVADAELARWSRETGVRFTRGTPWRWDRAPAERFAGAIDLLQGAFAASPREAPARQWSRVLAPAFALVIAAALVHVVAAVIDWSIVNVDAWRQARAWTDLARTAELAPSEAGNPASAKMAIAKRHADVRHAHGLTASADALPLLARVAPALATLAPGTVRNASYADGSWTLELARLDAVTLARLDDALRNAGAPALAATNDSATRVRIGAP